LNVFPIEVPPLRERREDIQMLVEHFVRRFANKAGKNIKSIDRKTMDVLQSYAWPGNIRELQNIIERSVILTSGEVLSVDELWLSRQTSRSNSMAEACGSVTTVTERPTERETIEKALAETRGRISGPSGAAAKLRIPASTLATRIKALGIDRSQFKFLGQGIPESPVRVRNSGNSRNSRNSGI
jgi:DNA-binding NtrC family response regulator